MIVGYYPGCALKGTSREYDESIRALNEKFSVELRELSDWNCCGASSGHMTNYKITLGLNLRNLCLAQQQKLSPLLVPCPLCSKIMLETVEELKQHPELHKELAEIVDGNYEFGVEVINYLQFVQRFYLEELDHMTLRTFKDLRVACYYGCLLTRPPDIVKFDDVEQPRIMEHIVEKLGVETVDWEFRTECCGAGFTLAEAGIVTELCHRILNNARLAGAQAIVVACPMCHANLDMRQQNIKKEFDVSFELPVIYLSELIGYALGIDAQRLGLHRHLVSPLSLLRTK